MASVLCPHYNNYASDKTYLVISFYVILIIWLTITFDKLLLTGKDFRQVEKPDSSATFVYRSHFKRLK